MKTSALLSLTACGIWLFLSGCGGGSVPAAPVVPAVSPLAGNWLIVGPMPTNEFSFPSTGGGFSLAMSFDVTGNDIVAEGFAKGSCAPQPPSPGIGSFEFPALSSGTIAADGSFTV